MRSPSMRLSTNVSFSQSIFPNLWDLKSLGAWPLNWYTTNKGSKQNTMTTMKRPNFIDSPYFVMELNNWHLLPGAPKEVVEEFDAFMKVLNFSYEEDKDHKENVTQ